MEHTATPWKHGEDNDVFATNGYGCVAIVVGASQGKGEGKANAEFIVRAVNNHDELVKTLVRAKDTFYDAARTFRLLHHDIAAEAMKIAYQDAKEKLNNLRP